MHHVVQDEVVAIGPVRQRVIAGQYHHGRAVTLGSRFLGGALPDACPISLNLLQVAEAAVGRVVGNVLLVPGMRADDIPCPPPTGCEV